MNHACPDGGRDHEPWRARLRHLLASVEGTYHLSDRCRSRRCRKLDCAHSYVLGVRESRKDISFYINSPGGVVTAGLAIYDTMRYIRPDVSTVCIGQAASMGSLLLCAGYTGKRYALPTARVMIHQPSGGAQGQASDIEIQAREILSSRARLNECMLSTRATILKRSKKPMDRDNFMSAEEAKEFGYPMKSFPSVQAAEDE